jgi:hypothetical protein
MCGIVQLLTVKYKRFMTYAVQDLTGFFRLVVSKIGLIIGRFLAKIQRYGNLSGLFSLNCVTPKIFLLGSLDKPG